MTKPSPFICLSVFTLTLMISGCELAPNTAKDAEITPAQPAQWIEGQFSKQQIHEGKTAFLPLYDGFISMAARLYLINKAHHHLDLQYYIWKDDYIGNMMLAQLLKAAERGVKVRLQIDDQNGTQLDDKLLALSQHPNIQVKLFNPYKFRKLRALDYGFRMKQVNHRMHNKLIIADGTAAVTGGRNISSEYFDASEDFQFTDVDIFFTGQSVNAANQTFIKFWNDDLSYNLQQVLNDAGNPEMLKKLKTEFAREDVDETELKRRVGIAEKQVEQQLKKQPIHWAPAYFVADTPAKARPHAKNGDYIYTHMLELMGEPKKHLELVSSYFIPTQEGTDYLTHRAQQGVKIRILTNSFQANDVALVYAYYQQYRQQLLQNGIELWEFKPYIVRPERTWYEVMTGNIIPAKNKNSSSLHAKFFDLDGMVFIGSFNFDPRSAFLNTEVGLVIQSEDFQKEITYAMDQYLPRIAYQLKLNEKNEIIWLEYQKDGRIIQHLHDPDTTKFQRFMMNLVTKFPGEWLM
ncbi:phospholipase D family protein [Acinetobacter pecorum]